MDKNEGGGGSKEPEEPKFKAFTGKGISLNDADDNSNPAGGVDMNSELYQTLAAEYGDDPEMIQGIMESMKME